MDRAAQKAAISSVCDEPPVALEVEGLGTVHIRRMNAYEAHHANLKIGTDQKDGLFTGRNLSMLIVDEHGEPIYDINDPADVLKLSKMRPAIYLKIMRIANDWLDEGK